MPHQEYRLSQCSTSTRGRTSVCASETSIFETYNRDWTMGEGVSVFAEFAEADEPALLEEPLNSSSPPVPSKPVSLEVEDEAGPNLDEANEAAVTHDELHVSTISGRTLTPRTALPENHRLSNQSQDVSAALPSFKTVPTTAVEQETPLTAGFVSAARFPEVKTSRIFHSWTPRSASQGRPILAGSTTVPIHSASPRSVPVSQCRALSQGCLPMTISTTIKTCVQSPRCHSRETKKCMSRVQSTSTAVTTASLQSRSSSESEFQWSAAPGKLSSPRRFLSSGLEVQRELDGRVSVGFKDRQLSRERGTWSQRHASRTPPPPVVQAHPMSRRCTLRSLPVASVVCVGGPSTQF